MTEIMCLEKVAVQTGLRPIQTLIGPAACGRFPEQRVETHLETESKQQPA